MSMWHYSLCVVLVALVYSTLLFAILQSLAGKINISPLTGARGWIVFSVIFLLMHIPLPSVSAAVYLRGVFGDLSIGTLGIIVLSLLARIQHIHVMDIKQRDHCMHLAALAAVILYPAALGLGPVDPYSWGFSNSALVVALLLVGLISWRSGHHLVPLWFGLAISAYLLPLYESNNLWDYLIDPLLAIYALCYLAKSRLKRSNLPASPVHSPSQQV